MQNNSHICPEFTKGGKWKAEESQAQILLRAQPQPCWLGHRHTAQFSKDLRGWMPQQPGLEMDPSTPLRLLHWYKTPKYGIQTWCLKSQHWLRVDLTVPGKAGPAWGVTNTQPFMALPWSVFSKCTLGSRLCFLRKAVTANHSGLGWKKTITAPLPTDPCFIIVKKPRSKSASFGPKLPFLLLSSSWTEKSLCHKTSGFQFSHLHKS